MEPHRDLEGDTPEINFLEYLDLLGKHLRSILLAGLAGLVIGVLLWAIRPPLFKANAKLKLDPLFRDVLGFSDGNSWERAYFRKEFFNTEFHVMKSQPVVSHVYDQLGEDYFREGQPGAGRSRSLFSLIKSRLTSDSDQDKVGQPKPDMRRGSIENMLRANMDVSQIRLTNLVSISFVGRTPEMAADVANAWVDAYISHGLNEKADSYGQALTILQDESARLRQVVEKQITEKAELEKGANTFTLGNNRLIEDETVAKLNQNLIQSESELGKARSDYEKLRNSNASDSVAVNKSPVVVALAQEVAEKKGTYEKDLRTYKPQAPNMVNLKKDIELAQRQLSAAQQKVYNELLNDLAGGIQAQTQALASLQETLAEKRQISSDSNQKNASRIAQLDSTIRLNRARLEAIDKQKEDLKLLLDINEVGRSDKIIVERATSPSQPFAPSLRRFALVGGLLGLLLAIGLIVVVEVTDRKIYTVDVLEKVTGLPTLAMVPTIKSRALTRAAERLREMTLTEILQRVKQLPAAEANLGEVVQMTKIAMEAAGTRDVTGVAEAGVAADDPKRFHQIITLAARAIKGGAKSRELYRIWHLAKFYKAQDVVQEEPNGPGKGRRKKFRPRLGRGWVTRWLPQGRRPIDEVAEAYAEGSNREEPGIGPRRMIGCLTHILPTSPFAESYRHLRTNIQLSRAEQNKVFLLTSGIPGEGKTISSINLAISFSQLDKRVLLVDGDLRRSKLSRIFNLSEKYGLVNYLVNQVERDDILQASVIPNLDLICAGTLPPNPSELLASQKMSDLMVCIREVYDYIIFDSSPCLLVTDACIIGHLADATIYVSKAGRTNREEVVRALQILQSNHIRPIGCLFNDVDSTKSGYQKYGYNYGYNQSYGYQQADFRPGKA